MGENDTRGRRPDDNHARLLRAAADLLRGKHLPPDGCMGDDAFDRLFESHKREGLIIRDACDALRERAEKAERERDDLRVDAEVLSDRFAEVRALADTYIDIVNRAARALGIPEVDEDGATPSLHDVPERVEKMRSALWHLWDRTAPWEDWACAQCRPDSDIIQPGFLCAYHAAKQVLQATEPASEPTDDDATQDPPGWGGGEVTDADA